MKAGKLQGGKNLGCGPGPITLIPVMHLMHFVIVCTLDPFSHEGKFPSEAILNFASGMARAGRFFVEARGTAVPQSGVGPVPTSSGARHARMQENVPVPRLWD